MPVYAFKCKACNHEFESKLRMLESDEPLNQPCPSCGETGSIEKQLFAAPLMDPVRMGIVQPSSQFRQRIKQIHEKHNSTYRGRYTNLTET